MKRAIWLLAIVVSTAACKKREENPIEPVPKNVRLVEAVSEGEGGRTKMEYDKEGKLTRIYSASMFDTTDMRFEYQGQWLSRLETEHEIINLSRDLLGRITVLHTQWKSISASRQKKVFYDAGGNLAFMISLDSSAYTSKEDTTFYSGHVDGRFTLATTNHSNNNLSRSSESKKWDAEGRLLEHSEIQQQLPVGSADGEWQTRVSTVTATTYFPLSAGERLYRENVLRMIKQHFSDNLDAFDLIMGGNFIPLDFYPERSVETRKGINNDEEKYMTECSIEKRNSQGLPTLIHHTSVRERPQDQKDPRTTTSERVTYYYED